MYGLGVIPVPFSLVSPLMSPEGRQLKVDLLPQRVKGPAVLPVRSLSYILQRNSPHAADSAGEIFVDDLLRDSYGFKYLAALVGLYRGDSHFGGDLYDAVEDGVVVVLDSRVVVLIQQLLLHQLAHCGMGQIGIDRRGPVA